jgi:hypothetical protein
MNLSAPAIYRPIWMKFGIQTEKHAESEKQIRKCAAIFQDGRRRNFEKCWNSGIQLLSIRF